MPIAALVENMAFFEDARGEVHHPFGKTQLDALREYAGVDAADAVRLPIEEAVSVACDEGAPLVASQPSSASAALLRGAAARLTLTLAHLQRGGGSADAVQLRFDPRRGIVMRILQGQDEGREFVLPRDRLHALPGAPTEGSQSSDDARQAGTFDGAPTKIELARDHETIVVRWPGGTQSTLSVADFKTAATADE